MLLVYIMSALFRGYALRTCIKSMNRATERIMIEISLTGVPGKGWWGKIVNRPEYRACR